MGGKGEKKKKRAREKEKTRKEKKRKRQKTKKRKYNKSFWLIFTKRMKILSTPSQIKRAESMCNPKHKNPYCIKYFNE